MARLCVTSVCRATRCFGSSDLFAAGRAGGSWSTTCVSQHAPAVSMFSHTPIAQIKSSALPLQAELPTEPGIPMHPGMKRSMLGHQNVAHTPIYNMDDLDITPKHRPTQGFRDNFAMALVGTLRGSFDLITGYNSNKTMTERHWLRRVLFLETVAGVPGMVGGMLRHLRSLRTMERDHGWIYTLIEEAENERMHLMTFLEVRGAGIFMRLSVAAVQGIFFNLFFVSYLLSPPTCHRFVGYLEEEAVKTYTHLLHDIDTPDSDVHRWNTMPAPSLAINYWQLEPNATMRDVVLVVRADEACHSHVNHAFGSIHQSANNPFRPDCSGPQGHEPPPTMEILKNVKDDFTKMAPGMTSKN
mmetsp:Transcript_49089/g.93788  ORF Transcript_49089/g.93788 Transcript_49089/m.93788 type:complete len:356 (-) Transcript_49089:478-1545(-)